MNTKNAIITSAITIAVLAGGGTGLAQIAAVTRHAATVERLNPLEARQIANQLAVLDLVGKYQIVCDVYFGQVADNATVDALVTREAVLRAQGEPLDGASDTSVRKSEERGTDWFWDLNRRSDLIDSRIVELKSFPTVDVKAENSKLTKLKAAAGQSHQLWLKTQSR